MTTMLERSEEMVDKQVRCWRRSKFDHLCRLNFDQGLGLSS